MTATKWVTAILCEGYDVAMDDLPPLPPLDKGLYRHYKGGEYEVLGTVRHSETLEPMVLYRPLYNLTGMWVRPVAMFLELVEVDGVVRPRFEKVEGHPRTATFHRPRTAEN